MEKLQEYEIDLSKIKPKNIKKSDKYSKAIYKYLKDNPWDRRVWYDKCCYDSDSGNYVLKEFDINNVNSSNLYFGMPNSNAVTHITGKCVSSLLSECRGCQETYSYICHKDSQFVEVTEEFFEKYIKDGRCVCSHRDRSCSEQQFTYLDDTHRKCNWCGIEQHEETKTYTHEYKVWVED